MKTCLKHVGDVLGGREGLGLKYRSSQNNRFSLIVIQLGLF